MALHVGQMTSQVAMRQCFKAVTTQPAQPLGLEGYGLAAAARLSRRSGPTSGAWRDSRNHI